VSTNWGKVQGVYTGVVETETMFGTVNFDITVATDGRNIKWEISW
jgi:hypothetical protein